MSGTVTSTVHAPISCHPHVDTVSSFILRMWRLGPREVKQFARCVPGRAWQSQNSKPSPLDSKLFPLYLSAPPHCLHSWQARLDLSLQAISESSSPANLRNKPICKRGGESHLRRESSFPPQLVEGEQFATGC